MDTMNYVVDYKKKLIRLSLAVFLIGSLFGCGANVVELKAKEFETDVHKDISLDASAYLKGVEKGSKVSLNAKVDNKKLGMYDVKLKYEGKEYVIKMKVVDKEKPVIVMKKKFFIFDLKTSVKDVHQVINKNVRITDNYDKVFHDIEVIDKIPTYEKEIICKLKVKDSSQNVSDVMEIKVQFTKDGKEKKGLKQEYKALEIIVKKAENEKVLSNDTADKKSEKKDTSTATNTKDSISDKAKDNRDSDASKGDSANTNSNSSQNSSNTSSGNDGGDVHTPAKKPNKPVEPAEPPRPSEQPKPNKPVQKPQLTVANAPDWMRDYDGLFATHVEAYNWANNQIGTEGSPYYGKTQIITTTLDDPEFIGVLYGVEIY